jgi:NAD(P)-dependent dehydrogenase (short-subunit alcohol dehydrogenase family)
MTHHPAIARGRVAVITGAASGIGLAAAEKLVVLGMKVCMADNAGDALEKAEARVLRHAAGRGDVRCVVTDVGKPEEVAHLREVAYGAFGEVALLMNNAGIGGGGGLFGDAERWRRVLDVNLWGIINGVQAFGPAMIGQGTPCAIVNTGSKQGITCPPGDTAYNVSKAGVKVVSEALAHELRNTAGCKVSAHLLIPGFTFTGITSGDRTQRPAGAWSAEEVIDFMLPAMARGDFYILCPDNEVSNELDSARILWAAQDIAQNRPPLSRWHPDYKQPFADYLAKSGL